MPSNHLIDINRSLIVVKPKQPYLDWAFHCREPMEDMILDRLREDTTAYLVDEVLDPGDEERMLRKYHKQIFENELAGWTTDESEWPVRRGFKTFLEWFEVEFHSVVLDLGKGGITQVL